MPPTSSTMLPLGSPIPSFSLPNYDGVVVSLNSLEGMKAILVVFACNHCPFVHHVKDELRRIHEDYGDLGLAVVAINPNDAEEYPEDSVPNMAEKAAEWGWKFPYLVDESQEIAKAFRASCTPDFYLFDESHSLVYRGQMDDSRPNSGSPATGADLRRAIEAVLAGEMPSDDQKPSVGCSIKWRPGNAPNYALSLM
jgi:peroxiredoxin